MIKFVKFLTPIAICDIAALIVAANWYSPDDPLAGIVIGYVGALIGLPLGVWWGSRD